MTALIPRPQAEVAPGAVHVPGWLDPGEQRESGLS
jgi:alkylated DNA repair protein (DNA oxidative demethylase)